MSRIDDDNFITAIHKRTDLSEHLQVLFGGRQIGPLDFEQLVDHCLKVTQTSVILSKQFRRFERLWALLRFQLHALEKCQAPLVECGVFRGFSALAMGLLMKAVADAGGPACRDLWLIDSYSGLSEPAEQDWITQNSAGNPVTGPAAQKGHFATSLETVEKNLAELKNAKFAKGWVPEVFNSLPAGQWSFVHVDVDLYQPVRDCLDYFYPKLEKGGVIINDDFLSPWFPGAGKAWREFFDSKNKGYAILDTGQAVFINN